MDATDSHLYYMSKHYTGIGRALCIFLVSRYSTYSSASTFFADVITYQPVPDKAYAVVDHHGRICILATINADLEIVYYTEYDERKVSAASCLKLLKSVYIHTT